MTSHRKSTTSDHRSDDGAPDEPGAAPHRRLRRVGAELLAGAAAAIGMLLVLRRRNQHATHGAANAAASQGTLLPMTTVESDERPGVIHAPGHRHRLRERPPDPPAHRDDHPPEPPTRHRDRGGRSTAFRSRRST